MRHTVVASALALAIVGCSSSSRDAFDEAPQQRPPVWAESTFVGMRGRYAAYIVTLHSAGVVATGRLLLPPAGAGSRRPAVLLEDGRELNSHAVDVLPANFGDVVVLSLDYPEDVPNEIALGDFFERSGRLRRAARGIPKLFSIGADYLGSRSDVDVTRLALVASSFAVPFAVNAAAFDERFVNVGLVYGAGRMDEVLAANLTLRPRLLRRPIAWLATRPFSEFAPERHIARIAPRPIVMVNGSDDPQMPRHAVESLYDAARQPKTLIWLRTGHLMPTDSLLVRALVDTALARLPVLRAR